MEKGADCEAEAVIFRKTQRMLCRQFVRANPDKLFLKRIRGFRPQRDFGSQPVVSEFERGVRANVNTAELLQVVSKYLSAEQSTEKQEVR